MTSKILVAIDSSKHAEKAFQYASDLAKKAEARLLIIHVFEELVLYCSIKNVCKISSAASFPLSFTTYVFVTNFLALV